MPTPPPNFDKFLAEWLEWAESGAPEHPSFDPDFGLCWNYQRWSGGSPSCYLYMKRVFGGDDYPFSPEPSYNSFHLNPKRIAWVKKELNNAL